MKKKYNQLNELIEQIQEAENLYSIAEANFNNADENFFDIANSELTIAKMKLDLLFKKYKKVVVLQ